MLLKEEIDFLERMISNLLLSDRLSLPYSFTINIEIIEPIESFLSRYKDIEYVTENLEEYGNIIYNNFVNTSVFVDKKELIIEYFDIFVFIMDKINEKIIDKLFDKYRYPSNGFDNLETNLQLFEDTILSNPKRNSSNGRILAGFCRSSLGKPMSSIDDIGFQRIIKDVFFT